MTVAQPTVIVVETTSSAETDSSSTDSGGDDNTLELIVIGVLLVVVCLCGVAIGWVPLGCPELEKRKEETPIEVDMAMPVALAVDMTPGDHPVRDRVPSMDCNTRPVIGAPPAYSAQSAPEKHSGGGPMMATGVAAPSNIRTPTNVQRYIARM